MPTWPASLPQKPNLDGFKDVPQDTVIRSRMDGLTKQRNRFTAAPHDVTERYLLTKDQFETFRTWYKNTLGNGAEQFDKPDPLEGGTAIYQFVSPYQPMPVGGYWRITINLEKLP